tara:strand:- start:340 stop:489 length:150 start_codon:yes stop_codon:yes gene_type:complete
MNENLVALKALAWDKLLDYFSHNTGTEDDTERDFVMRGLMASMLAEVSE